MATHLALRISEMFTIGDQFFLKNESMKVGSQKLSSYDKLKPIHDFNFIKGQKSLVECNSRKDSICVQDLDHKQTRLLFSRIVKPPGGFKKQRELRNKC